MNTQVSTPIKIFAAVGLVLILGLGAMTMLNKGGSPSTSASNVVLTHPTATPPVATPTTAHPVRAHPTAKRPAAVAPAAHVATPKATAHATKPVAHAAAKPATHATAKPVTHPATHPAASASKAPAQSTHPAKAHAKAPPAVAANGLPTPLDLLLHVHRVVVVAVWDPEVPTDTLFVAEARAGAKDAHAGFLAVSVLDNRVAGPLTAVAGNGALLPSPGLLVYKQPTLLMNVITGFVDRAAVVQAVANALTADQPSGSTATTPTATVP